MDTSVAPDPVAETPDILSPDDPILEGGPTSDPVASVAKLDLSTGAGEVTEDPSFSAPIAALPNPYEPYDQTAFAANIAATMPDRIPTVDSDGNISDTDAYMATLASNDPKTYAAIKADPSGQVGLATILNDRQMELKIAEAPPGTDPLADDFDVFQYAKRRGLLPPTPGAAAIGAAAVGDLWNGAKGLGTTADLAIMATGQVPGMTLDEATEAQDDLGHIVAAGAKRGLFDGAQLAAGAGSVMNKMMASGTFNAITSHLGLGSLTPEQRQTELDCGDFTMYQVNVSIAKANQKTQENLQAITNLPPEMLEQAASGISQVLNPANLVPVHEAFSAVAGGVRSAFQLADRSLPGVTEGLAVTSREAAANLATANASFNAVAIDASQLGMEGIADHPGYQNALAATKTAQKASDAAQSAFAASQAADELAQKKALQAPLATRLAGGAAQAVGSALQLPARVSDAIGTSVDNFAQRVADGNPGAQRMIKSAAGSLAAGAAGYAADEVSPDNGHNGFIAAAAGALGIQGMNWAGRDLVAAGKQLVIGKVATPYFARLAADTSASGATRFLAQRVLDPLTPFVAPFLDKAAAAASGAVAALPVGAAFGFVQSGGTVSGALSGAAGVVPVGLVGGLAGSLTPSYAENQAAMTGEADRQYLMTRWAGNDVAMARFNQLSLADQTRLANWAHANPDFTPLFTNSKADVDFMKSQGVLSLDAQGPAGGGVTFKAANGQVYIALDPSSPDAFGPVIAHELRHSMQLDPELSQDVETTLVGNADAQIPGVYSKLDPSGHPVVQRDAQGVASYQTNDEFNTLKAQYATRVSAATGTPYTLSDGDFARELDAETSAQTWLQTGAFNESLRPTVSGMLAKKFQDIPFLRGLLASQGFSFSLDGDVQTPNAAFKGMTTSPEANKLVDAYTTAWSRRSPDAVQSADPDTISLTPESLEKNPGLITLLDASSDLMRDKNGNVPGISTDPVMGKQFVSDPAKVFKTAKQANDDVAAMSAAVDKSVRDSVASTPLVDADVVQPRFNADGSKVVAGRYFADDQMQRILATGTFNPIQEAQLANLNGLMRSGDPGFIRAFYQPALRGGKYAARAGHWVEEVPLSFSLTKDSNLVVRTVAPDKLARNLEHLWKDPAGQARALWPSTASMFADSLTYLRDLGAGKEGASTVGEAKRDVLNVATGLRGTDRGSANPLYDSTPKKGLTPIIVSRRFDRINRLQPGIRGNAPLFSHQTYERIKANYLPPNPLTPEPVILSHEDLDALVHEILHSPAPVAEGSPDSGPPVDEPAQAVPAAAPVT